MTVDTWNPRAVAVMAFLALLCGALFGHLVGVRTDRILEDVRVDVEAQLDACTFEHATPCEVRDLRIVPAGRR